MDKFGTDYDSNDKLIQLTLSISRASSEAATFANGNINKLAIAAGAEDWNGILGKIHVLELSVQDAQSYFIQGEKYFLGFGYVACNGLINRVAKSYDLAFKRYHTAAKLGIDLLELTEKVFLKLQ